MRTDRAARDIRKKKTEYISDAAQRQKIGQIEDAQQTAEYQDVLQQEADLTAGHGVLRCTGLVAVSASDPDELERAVAAIEQAAIQASCETRRLWGQQAQAFAVGSAAAVPIRLTAQSRSGRHSRSPCPATVRAGGCTTRTSIDENPSHPRSHRCPPSTTRSPTPTKLREAVRGLAHATRSIEDPTVDLSRPRLDQLRAGVADPVAAPARRLPRRPGDASGLDERRPARRAGPRRTGCPGSFIGPPR